MSDPTLSLAGCRILDERLTPLTQSPQPVVSGHDLVAELATDRLWLLPGVTDLSCRLGEPGGPHPASLGTELRAARRNGFDTVVMNPDSTPCVDNAAVIEWIEHRASAANGAQLRLLGALTQQLDGRTLSAMDGLRSSGVVGLSQGLHPLPDKSVLANAMRYAADLRLCVHLLARDAELHVGVVAAGPLAMSLGLPGIPVAAETAGLATIIALVEETGCPVHVGRISSASAVDWLRWARHRGLPLTADVSLHHLLLDERVIDEFNPYARFDPPLRSASDREALVDAVTDGTIDAICTDHTPHADDRYQQPLASIPSGAVGFDGFYPLLINHPSLAAIPLERRLAAVSSTPAKIAGLSHEPIGVLFEAAGSETSLSRNSMHSATRNTPLSGMKVQGCVRGVIQRDGAHLFPTSEMND